MCEKDVKDFKEREEFLKQVADSLSICSAHIQAYKKAKDKQRARYWTALHRCLVHACAEMHQVIRDIDKPIKEETDE